MVKVAKFQAINWPLVSVYNRCMGGVDRADQLLAFYRIKTKSIKWYKRLLYHFIDLALINAYVLYKEVEKLPKLALYKFKLEVAMEMMFGGTLQNPTSPATLALLTEPQEFSKNVDPVGRRDHPPTDFRTSVGDHFPENVAKKQRCCKLPGCKRRSVIWCRKCKVYLCIKKEDNCFILYHTKPTL